MHKGVTYWVDFALVIAIMGMSCIMLSFTWRYMNDGIANYYEDKTAVNISKYSSGYDVYLGYNCYVNNQGKLIEDKNRLVYESEESMSGIDILLSAVLCGEYPQYPRRIEVVKDSSSLRAGDESNRTQIIMDNAFASSVINSVTKVYASDKKGNKLLSDYLEDEVYNRLVFIPKDVYGFKQDSWVLYQNNVVLERN